MWHAAPVSFDVFFQPFRNGEAGSGGGDRMRAVLRPHITREEPEQKFARVEIGTGSADVYLDDDSMLANRISGEEPWDLLVQGARAAGWVILPVGCPTCITDEQQREHLPPELKEEEVVLVSSGAELLGAIRAS